MKLNFTRPNPEEVAKIAPFYSMRPNKTCDTGVLNTFLWKDYYNVCTSLVDDKAVLSVMESKGEYFSAMPYCSEEDLPYYFDLIKQYFNEELKKPLKIYLADEEAVELLKLKDDDRFLVKEEVDLKDYIYDGEELRTLPGKKFHKKKNLVNKFMKTYEGRWEYRTLCCKAKDDVLDFLDKWYCNRTSDEDNADESLEFEARGIKEVLKGCFSFEHFKAGGIYIDGKLEAFSLGALNPREDMACISIEKANPEIPGIYQVINQQFIVNEFPNVKLVNREDDLGLEGLRKAKTSYNPCCFERKYMVLQKDFKGWKNEITDQYEEEIENYSE